MYSRCTSGAFCWQPSRHMFSLVFLCLQANAEIVPRFQVATACSSKPLLVTILTSSLAHCPYQEGERAQPGNLLTKRRNFFIYCSTLHSHVSLSQRSASTIVLTIRITTTVMLEARGCFDTIIFRFLSACSYRRVQSVRIVVSISPSVSLYL